MAPLHTPAIEAPWRFLHGALRRAPLLVPLVVVCCTIVGGVWGWAGAVVALAVTVGVGMRRIALCAALCGVVVGLTQAVSREREEELHGVLAQHGVVELSGVVVQRLGHGCVVQTAWPGLRVAVQGDMEWNVADEVHLVAEPLPADPPPVKGMFSTENWQRGQGICARLALLQGERLGCSSGWWRLVRLAGDARERLAALLMPPGTESDPRRQTLCALLLGEKSLAEADTMELFRRGGCLHVFAVSGLHVGLVAGIVGALLRLMRVHPAVGRWALLVVVGGYVGVTGLAAPALRAYLLLAALLFGLILRRRPVLLNTWCFAALFLLMLRPTQLYQAGFQLSFAIYGAICVGVGYGMRCARWFGPDSYLPTRLYTRADRFMAAADVMLRGVVLVSFCAWLAALPFSIAHFHVVNTASYLTNLAITPLLPVVMCCGLLALCFGALPWVGALCHWLALQSAGALMWLVSLSSSYPGAFLPAEPPASPSAAMVVTLRYGQSFAVLGNPGLLVGDIQRASSARHEIEPAVFHAGFSPALISGASELSLPIYSRSWPSALSLPAERGRCATYHTAAGRYLVCSPDPRLPGKACPVVLWQQPGGARVIYIGDAAASTLELLPEPERRADIIILGHNARDPVVGADLLRGFAAGALVLLPSASQVPAESWSLPGVKLLRLSSGEIFRLPQR